MADLTLVLSMVAGIILVSTGGVVALVLAAAYALRAGEPGAVERRRPEATRRRPRGTDPGHVRGEILAAHGPPAR